MTDQTHAIGLSDDDLNDVDGGPGYIKFDSIKGESLEAAKPKIRRKVEVYSFASTS